MLDLSNNQKNVNKTTQKTFHTKQVKNKSLTTRSNSKNVRKTKLINFWQTCKLVQTLQRAIWQHLIKYIRQIFHNPETPTPHACAEETCIRMCMEALLVIENAGGKLIKVCFHLFTRGILNIRLEIYMFNLNTKH